MFELEEPVMHIQNVSVTYWEEEHRRHQVLRLGWNMRKSQLSENCRNGKRGVPDGGSGTGFPAGGGGGLLLIVHDRSNEKSACDVQHSKSRGMLMPDQDGSKSCNSPFATAGEKMGSITTFHTRNLLPNW